MPGETPAILHALCAFRPRTTARNLATLLRYAKTPERAWTADEFLLRRAGWLPETIRALTEHRRQWDIPREYERLTETGIHLIALSDDAYPALLRHIYDPPIALYARGSPPNHPQAIAVVGSRHATPYGRTAVHILVRPLASRGFPIVSGLAYGIDAEAHRATVEVTGTTIAVLGSGADEASLYPRGNRALARDIAAAGGAVVSEYAPGTPARAEHFPQRNRIIAGFSRAVIVVEASRVSGALITARCALEENRDVFAVPGPITSVTSEGTNLLLREGATPACSADDILRALALEEMIRLPVMTPASPPTGGLSTTHPILDALSTDPKAIDEIVAATTLPAHAIVAELSLLELDGRVRDVGGKQYVRV